MFKNKSVLLKYFIAIIFGGALMLFVLVYYSSLSKSESSFKKMSLNDNKNYSFAFDTLNFSQFDYKKYFASDNWKNPQIIKNDLNSLNKTHTDSFANVNFLSLALTKKMIFWETYNLDSLNLLITWVDKFNSTTDTGLDKLLMQAVFGHWIGVVSNKLDTLNQNDYSQQFNFKFRYLRTRCCQLQSDCGDRDDNESKILKYIMDQKWGYMFKRFWFSTSVFYKIIMVIFLLITIYGYICIINKHIKKPI